MPAVDGRAGATGGATAIVVRGKELAEIGLQQPPPSVLPVA
eukprot:SAG31_NODE_13214_length_885_cov_1.298982_1_plen_40_part_10